MNKKLALAAILFLNVLAGYSAGTTQAWEELYPQIEKNIKAPKFRNVEYDIRDFGAKANPVNLNSRAINNAIAKCSSEGGGKVIIPEGKWLTGPITMLANVNLHISKGATLLFTTDINQFPFVLTRWEGVDCYNFQPLIYAYKQNNIALTGEGTVDGGASADNWWSMSGKDRHKWVEGMVSQRTGKPKLMQWNDNNTPLDQRRLTPEDGMRPQLINFYSCDNVLIEDVRLTRTPFWTIHPVLCNNVTVKGVKIETFGAPNGDGCDPESSRNVLIEDCYFDTGDDCIAIKSGRNGDGRRAGIPSENIIVRNCHMTNGHGGVVVGSEISGGYKNLFVENCMMDSPLLLRAIRIKTNNCRGGIIENIYVRNVEVKQCKDAVLKITLNYHPGEVEVGNCSYPPTVRNVYMENVTSKASRYGILINAYDNSTNVHDVYVNNCRWDGVRENNFIKGKVDNLEKKNLYINGQKID